MPEYSSTPLPDGIRLLAEGDIDRAIPLLARAVRMSPDSFEPHLRLADAYAAKARKEGQAFRIMAQHEFDEAVRTVQPLQSQHDSLTRFAVEAGFAPRLTAEYQSRFKGLPFASSCIRALEAAGQPAARQAGSPLGRFLRNNWILGAGLAISAGLLAWGLLPAVKPAPSGSGSPSQAASPAADFTLRDLDGANVTLSSFRGTNVVILDFWATWCGPCRMAMPVLQNLRNRFGARGLVVLSINLREDPGLVQQFVLANKYTMRILLDSDGTVTGTWGVSGIPTLVVVDKEGIVRHRHSGFTGDMEETLAGIIEPLL
jgi:thiol-disulfide isomerase/thioredoxin